MKWAKGLSLVASLSVPVVTVTQPISAYAAGVQQPATGRVSGTVVDAATGTPIPGVNVVVVGTQHGATTDASGRFTVRGLPNGQAQLRAQRIGFAPLTQSVTVANGAA